MEGILKLKDGGHLSYRRIEGNKKTGILFMHGTLSDKNASKSLFLQDVCKKNGWSFTAFDFIGHGEASGKYTDGTIGIWLGNALAVIDALIPSIEQTILVGSSMGGWIALLAAKERPNRVQGVVGLAAAPDFTVDLWKSFTKKQQADILEKGIIYIPNGWTEDGDPWTKLLFDDAEKYLLLKGEGALNIDCPMTLIQGQKDDCVSPNTPFEIMRAAKSENVKVVVLKNSGHRLSEPDELAVLEKELSYYI